jgi:hypothetical protein
MDIRNLERIVAEFTDKYHFVPWKEVEKVEKKTKPMFTKKQLQMDGKSFVNITEYYDKNTNRKEYVLFISKVDFILEDGEYSVETYNDSFSINVTDISDEQTLVETMIEKCKEYNYL